MNDHRVGRSFRRRAAVFAAGLLAGPAGWVPAVVGQSNCDIEQLLKSLPPDSHRYLQLDQTGRRMVWEGSSNPVGANADRNTEIFWYALDDGKITQITDTKFGDVNQNSDISANGEWVVFSSNADLLGANPDRSFEVYRYETGAGVLRQITAAPSGDSAIGRVSGTGERVVIQSNADLVGENPDRNTEIFYTDDGGATLVQLTRTFTLTNEKPVISPEGSLIAFTSSANFVGTNVDGNRELFLFDVAADTFRQLTNTTGACLSEPPTFYGPGFDLSAELLVFSSNCNQVGGNADGSFEVFLADLKTDSIEQVTASSFDSFAASISGDGRFIGLYSRGADFAGDNSDSSREVFVYERSAERFEQIIDTPVGGFTAGGGLNGDATLVALASAANPVGDNINLNVEPFLARCPEFAAEPTSLVAALSPSGRSVRVGDTATAFATIINTGSADAFSCAIALDSEADVDFGYQTTDPESNALIGRANTPVRIAAAMPQSFVISLKPRKEILPGDLEFVFACSNADPAQRIPGVNTLFFSASADPVPDIVALAATISGDGLVSLPGVGGSGAFAVATVNLGVAGDMRIAADTGNLTLPLTVTVCETQPASGNCINPSLPSPEPVFTRIESGASPTFAFFLGATGPVSRDPAVNRVFVKIVDSTGAVRGTTSVAVTTEP